MPKRFPSFCAGATPDQLGYISSTYAQPTTPVTTENAIATLNELVPFLYPHVAWNLPSLLVYTFEQTQNYPANAYVAHLCLTPIDSRLPAGQNEFRSQPMPNKRDAKKLVALAACHALHRRNLPSQDTVLPATAPLEPAQPAQQTSFSVGPPQPSLNRPAQLPTLRTLNPLTRPQLAPQVALPSPSPQPSTVETINPRVQSPSTKLAPPASPTDTSDLPKLVPLACPNPFGQVRLADQVFLHSLTLHHSPPDAQPYALGLVSARPLEPGANERTINGHVLKYKLSAPVTLSWTANLGLSSLDTFTRLVIQTAVCRTPYSGELTYLLAPLTPAGDIDVAILGEPMKAVSCLDDLAAAELLISPLETLCYRLFRPKPTTANLALTSTHADILPDSCLALFTKDLPKYSSLAHFYTELLAIPAELQTGPLMKLDSVLSLSVNGDVLLVSPEDEEPHTALLPLGVLQRTRLPLAFWRTAAYLPFLARAITDASHAQVVCAQVGSVRLSDARVIEALTPPGRDVGTDYGMLELVGEAFLKLASTVHLYLSNPSPDNSALSGLRSRQTDNAFLRRKLLDSGLAKHILRSRFRTGDKFVAVNEQEDGKLWEDAESQADLVKPKLLSDVAEALLGAAYVSGGAEEGLLVGTRMGLCFGDTTLWEARLGVTTNGAMARAAGGATGKVDAAPDRLEVRLGYTFTDQRLLVRALTHRSAARDDGCYQRLQWLGEGVLYLWAVQLLYHKQSSETSTQVRVVRASLVSKGTLGFLGLRKLGLADLIEHNVDGLANQLNHAMEEYGQFESVGAFFEDLANAFAIAEAPEIVSDVVEALVGAVFVDCGFKLKEAFEVLKRVYEDLVGPQNKGEPLPPSHLLESLSGCKQTMFKTRVHTDTTQTPAPQMMIYDCDGMGL